MSSVIQSYHFLSHFIAGMLPDRREDKISFLKQKKTNVRSGCPFCTSLFCFSANFFLCFSFFLGGGGGGGKVKGVSSL